MGHDEVSRKTATTVDSVTVSSKLETQDFVAIKVESNSETYRQFVQIYQLVPVPSLFFIGGNGIPLEVIAGDVDEGELVRRIDSVLEKCKGKPKEGPLITMNSHAERNQFDIKREEDPLSVIEIKTEPEDIKTEAEECDDKRQCLIPQPTEDRKSEIKTEAEGYNSVRESIYIKHENIPQRITFMSELNFLDCVFQRQCVVAMQYPIPYTCDSEARRFRILECVWIFKERGANHAIYKMKERNPNVAGAVSASAGNHASVMAYRDKLMGVPVVVVMSFTAPMMKRKLCEDLGATVVLYGTTLADCKKYGLNYAKNKGMEYIDGVAVILSGGNIDVTVLARVIERALAADGRLIELLQDKPTQLPELLQEIGAIGANVVHLEENRAFVQSQIWNVEVQIRCKVLGKDMINKLREAMRCKYGNRFRMFENPVLK